MQTFTAAIALALVALDIPAAAPAEGVTRVDILDPAGGVVASQDSGYVFSGLAAGTYTMRASLLDVNGDVIGTPYAQSFVAAEQTRTVQVPGGATITVTADPVE